MDLAQRYARHPNMPHELWQELSRAYTQSGRHYHDLLHLGAMLAELSLVQPAIQDWDALLFALFYHDAVYEVSQTDNEAQSAQLALARLSDLGLPAERIDHCCALILATQHHAHSPLPDADLFTDADLSILGQAPETYQTYTAQIRQEYSIYPDPLYFPGRAKVLMHFLAMPHLYKTDYFRNRYEQQARTNLAAELAAISGGQ